MVLVSWMRRRRSASTWRRCSQRSACSAAAVVRVFGVAWNMHEMLADPKGVPEMTHPCALECVRARPRRQVARDLFRFWENVVDRELSKRLFHERVKGLWQRRRPRACRSRVVSKGNEAGKRVGALGNDMVAASL